MKRPHGGKGEITLQPTKKKEIEPDFSTRLTVCELTWLASVCPAAETKTSFPDCGATVHVEDEAPGGEERPAVRESTVSLFETARECVGTVVCVIDREATCLSGTRRGCWWSGGRGGS